jgi:hypothetical protein
MSLPVPALPASALTTSTPWAGVVEAYLDAALDSSHTRRAYERHLRNAFADLGVVTVTELTGVDLARYRAAVVSSDRAPGSQAQALAALRSFLAWSRTIGFGTTDRIRGRLALHPRASVLRLTSPGGRVAEGRKLRDLVASRGMVTYVDGECMSACALAFVAGRERVLNSEKGVIGLHQYGFPGVQTWMLVDDYAEDKKFAINAGVDREFVGRMLSLQNGDMWEPSHEELLASQFVTMLSDGSGFSIDTDDPKGWVRELSASLQDQRLYRVIALHDPANLADAEAAILYGAAAGP